ncbi:hypothetical protein [Pseudodesulfovibrio senegalensis]|jgi:hypothetical protein|uniref:Uncharacterized protein n=1 Tax=Pseudodesulfovibrio senegalensis TaxID=1721087 RepID=A0A6N6N0K9_9BACT|nr:hypothetical protein [Pseudodesulfovibrio senegalensis]KAB1441237.1 hypothetical protein F8A88_12475 [Pseudodesulfovibrio senegalensis]
MNTEKTNLHLVEDVSEQEDVVAEKAAQERTGRDMSRVAMIVSLLSVVLLAIFFFGLNRNIAGVADEVKALRTLKSDVQVLGSRVDSLEEIPVHMQYGMVSEMETQSVLLSRQVTDPEQMERLQKVRALLNEFKSVLVKK